MSLVSKVKDLLWTDWTIFRAVFQFLSRIPLCFYVKEKQDEMHSSAAFSYNTILCAIWQDNVAFVWLIADDTHTRGESSLQTSL